MIQQVTQLISETLVTRHGIAATSDATRSIAAGGIQPWPSGGNYIEYVTTQTTGDATDFGDLTVGRDMGGNAAASDGTYAVFIMGGTSSNPYTSNVLDYVTIQTTGNATDFGDSAAQAEKGVQSQVQLLRENYEYSKSKYNR